MQRKNNILNTSSRPTYKQGMALIMAIVVIVIVATILALSMSLTALSTKRTSSLYLYEQSALLSQSAKEYALLKISKVAPCSLDKLNFTYNTIYNVSISMKYISTAGSACETNANIDGTNFATVTYGPTNGTVILDTTISVTDANISSEPIRYFRRTLEKL